MSKYIDADKLCDGRVSNDPVVIAAKCAPEEDVSPVVHAHWVLTEFYGEKVFRCSNKKCLAMISPTVVPTAYCPHCGAKMDEEAEK